MRVCVGRSFLFFLNEMKDGVESTKRNTHVDWYQGQIWLERGRFGIKEELKVALVQPVAYDVSVEAFVPDPA